MSNAFDSNATLFVREADGQYRVAADAAINSEALRRLALRLNTAPIFSAPGDAKEFLRLQLGALEHEEFAVMFLDSQLRLLSFERMFRGTLTQTSVYPREVVKAALRCNAAALVLAHNHPNSAGCCEPSRSDEFLTGNIKEAANLIGVRVMDHIIVSAGSAVSMAERGLI